jgi:hypothetical protein
VKAGTGSGGDMAITKGSLEIGVADTDMFAAVSDLNGATDYDVYVVAEDSETPPNMQLAPEMVTVTTAIQQVDLSLSQLVSADSVNIGAGFSYTLTVNTVGPDTAFMCNW